MPKSLPISLVLALVTALLVVGCGGGNEGDGTSAAAASSAPLSKDEFIKRAEEICTEADARKTRKAAGYAARYKKELEALSPVAAEEKILRAIVLPSIMKQAEEIEALGAPKGEEEKVKELLAAVKLGMVKARKNPYAIELENPNEYPFRRYANLARSYGLTECRNLA
jgi:hypothetical protein